MVLFYNTSCCAQIAQLVEQRTENPRVLGSIPSLGIGYARMAQWQSIALPRRGPRVRISFRAFPIFMMGCRQAVKAQDFDSCTRWFKSTQPRIQINKIIAMMGCRQVVRQWILTPSCAGSNPASLVFHSLHCEASEYFQSLCSLRSCGGIGIRARLRIQSG